MKERPILFSAPMVRAILENRKTQTRRIVKTQPKCDVSPEWPRCKTFNPSFDADGSVHCANCGHGMRLTRNGAVGIRCPYGKPGDQLWVRETWAAHVGWDKLKPSDLAHDANANFWFAADPEGTDGTADIPSFRRGKWRPSIHMPRWASRILLEITDVRVQRLQDISEEDAIAEGCESWEQTQEDIDDCQISDCSPDVKELARLLGPGVMPAKAEFHMLWNEINGVKAWDLNPWVWSISFRRI